MSASISDDPDGKGARSAADRTSGTAAEIARLRAALAWYADIVRYNIRRLQDDVAPVMLDKGEPAREALGRSGSDV